jgi:hypothetical protein
MPKSLLGKYASGLLILFLLCLTTVSYGLQNGMTPPGSIQARIIGTSMLIAGLAAFVTGLVSLIKLRDRSLAVVVTVVLGVVAVLITAMEVGEMVGH